MPFIDNYFLFAYMWIAIGFVAFPFILKYDAPYGRHTSNNWGPLVDNKLAWIVMELPALILCPLIVFLSENILSNVTKFFILLWVIHYFNRSVIFPIRIKTNKKKMPFIIAFLAIIFNVINGLINGLYFSNIGYNYPELWVFSPQFIFGIIVFVFGFYINNVSDSYLIGLRKDHNNQYVIPQKGLFKFVSCPNFFGEIVEWLGFAIMTWSIAGLAFFLWTFFNLVPRALSHHRWYIEKFPDYPKNRKAVFPFIL
tara:strand:- start:1101 stop:1862 length:762 start_codon:yes stop_codon:yes gene_type:complete